MADSSHGILAERYRLDHLLGAGGMGEVYRATDLWTSETVALKRIRSGRDDAQTRRLFEREVRAVARLDHPGIARVIDMGLRDQELPFYVMEYVEGLSLSELAAHGFTWKEGRELFDQILATLAFVHARGVVHRDIKPDNILIHDADGPWRARLVDFGIARLLTEYEPQSAHGESPLGKSTMLSGTTAGTPAYMSPEQARGQSHLVGASTDLYAFGTILFELIAGEHPFGSNDTSTQIMKHLAAPIPRLRWSGRQTVPHELDELVRDLMTKDARSRPWCATEVRRRLSQVPHAHIDDRLLIRPEAFEPTAERASATAATAEAVDLSAIRKAVRTSQNEVAQRGQAPPTVDAARATEVLGPGKYTSGSFQVVSKRLMSLRSVPLVGRGSLQRHLFDSADALLNSTGMKMLVLEGPRGVGKSRLAAWLRAELAERALYVTLACSAASSDDGSALEGLRRECSRALGIDPFHPMRVPETLRIIGGRRSKDRVQRLTGVLTGTRTRSERLTTNLATHYADYAELLDVIRRGRAIALFVDDIERSDPEGMTGLLSYLLDTQLERGFPILVVATMSSDASFPSNDSLTALHRLLRHGRVEAVDVPLLSQKAARELVQHVVPLTDHDANVLVEMVGTAPFDIMRSLHQLVERGWLQLTGDGYRLAGDRLDPELLRGWRDSESAFLESALEGNSDAVRLRTALRVAALTGRVLDIGRVEAALMQGEHWDREDVQRAIYTWVRVGALRDDSSGVCFTRGVLYELMRAEADRDERAPRWHAEMALWLLDGHRPREPWQGVIGTHLAAAGDPRAFDHLLTGARIALRTGRIAQGDRWLIAAERELDELGVLLGDPKRVRLGVTLGLRALDKADTLVLDRVRRWLDESGLPVARAWRSWLDAEDAISRGRAERAIPAAGRARQGFGLLGALAEEIRAATTLGEALWRADEFDAALELLTETVAAAEAHGLGLAGARAYYELGWAKLGAGDAAGAREAALAMRARLPKVGDPGDAADAYHLEAAALIELGNRARADECAEKALREYRLSGSRLARVELKLRMAKLRRETRPAEALALSETALEHARELANPELVTRSLIASARSQERLAQLDDARRSLARAALQAREYKARPVEVFALGELERLSKSPAEAERWAALIRRRQGDAPVRPGDASSTTNRASSDAADRELHALAETHVKSQTTRVS